MALTEVPIAPLRPERFRGILGEGYEEVERTIEVASNVFAGRVVWHVNSTSKGGGVVELLSSLLAYARGAHVDTRWCVIDGGPEFFRLTKRIHNRLHGAAGDGGPLGAAEREVYERTLAANADELVSRMRPGDIVFLHDPQTAGLVDAVDRTGARVVWRCHVGLDEPNGLAQEAWTFLVPYVEGAHSYVFSRREFVWEGLDPDKVWIVAPSIDAFSPKNQDLSPGAVAGILGRVGLLDPDGEDPVFVRFDGTPGRVDRVAGLDQAATLDGRRTVAQISRWDRLKDPEGLLKMFADNADRLDADLLLAGPSVEAVADDPEGKEVLAQVRAQRDALPAGVRDRVHLATLPMSDVEENAAIVNAIQRRADIVVQKSLAEGFGLTVAEAMWKARPVVASGVGGIQDQIVDGTSGVLIEDPRDLDAFSDAIHGLLSDTARAREIGAAARERVRAEFLGTRHLIQYTALLQTLIV